MFTEKTKTKIEIPPEFTEDIVETINRIEHNFTSIGVVYFKKDAVIMYTVPQAVMLVLSNRLPYFEKVLKQAVHELDVLDDLVAYRIVTKKGEISVATGPDFAAVAVHRKKTKWDAALLKHQPLFRSAKKLG